MGEYEMPAGGKVDGKFRQFRMSRIPNRQIVENC